MKSTSKPQGAALIITLAMIAMMTFLIVAFFSRSVANLQVESASTGTARADILARSVGEIVVSDFKSEIIAGSKASGTSAQAPVYFPTPVINGSNPPTFPTAVPALSRYAFTDTATFAPLVKQSTGRFYPDIAPYNSNVKPIVQAVTDVTTDVTSLNGRSMINKRWDNPADTAVPLGPLLLMNANPQTPPTYTRFYSNSMLPHWVMMTRQGVPTSQTWTADWKNYSPENPNAAIGRFAYNIYNTGGLLDVNVAGYQENSGSSALTVTAVGQKGTLGLAKLSLIPGMNASQNLASAFTQTWRNSASGKTTDDYLAYLGFSKNGTTDLTGSSFFMAGPKTGFLKAAAGTSSADNRILGRQDLIRLAIKTPTSAPPYGLSMTTLPYLTHFSREVNAPSWSPVQNAATMGGNNGTATTGLAPYAYLDNKDNSAVANRFFPNVRVTASGGWTRLTGEKAVAGEPLIKYRFPLSWLALLQDANPATTDWDLTPEAVAIVKALDARNTANGGPGLSGASVNQKAAYLVQRAFGLSWDKTNYRWNYTGSTTPYSPTAPALASLELLGDATSATPTVSGESREPNFFELLRAGILSGSLGNASDFESMCANIGADANPDYQVIQIGANIIDQADSDSYPTRIAFGYEMDSPPNLLAAKTASNSPSPSPTGEPKIFAGVEDVPYIYSFLSTPYRIPIGEANVNSSTDPNSTTQDAQQDTIDGWLQFVLWKPQQPATAVVTPPKYRILFSGSNIHMTYYGDNNNPTEFPAGSGVKYGARDTAPFLGDGTSVTFNDSPTDFRIPTLLGGMDAATAHGFSASQPQGNGKNPNGSAQLPRGMWLGETYRPEQIGDPASPNYKAPQFTHTEFRCFPDSKFELQYQDGSNTWRTYQRYNRFGVGTGQYFRGRGLFGYADSPYPLKQEGSPISQSKVGVAPVYYTYLDLTTLAMSAIDPRSQRFGLLAQYFDSVAPSYYTAPILAPTGTAFPANWKYYLKQGWAPKSGTPYNMIFGPSSTNGRFTPNWSGGTVQNPWSSHSSNNAILDPTKFWVDNAATTAGSISYSDMDLVQRRSDGDSGNSVRPMQYANAAAPNTQDLGRVLNRPFRSVGELGYVFRDEPYKSLNLFTDKSADSALLDLFSVTEQPAIVAGKVNLNTQTPEVLQAVISGAVREELSTTNSISDADALTYAKNLINGRTDGTTGVVYPGTNKAPLLNPGEIANRLVTMVPVATVADQAIKTRREAIGRALAGSGQTRTWNFLVDLVAQSGRYAPSATTAAQFVVEGEKRYWLHLAIDRFTGQVVDQQLEPVME